MAYSIRQGHYRAGLSSDHKFWLCKVGPDGMAGMWVGMLEFRVSYSARDNSEVRDGPLGWLHSYFRLLSIVLIGMMLILDLLICCMFNKIY